MRSTMPERSVLYVLLVGLLALAMATGCGGEDGGGYAGAGDTPSTTASDRLDRPVAEYEEVLLDLRDAAAAGEVHDAYGFAEYMPLPQRAAIDAFCFVTERLLNDGEVERFGEPAGVAREVDAQAQEEFDHGDPAPIGRSEIEAARKAIRKLRSIIEFEAIDEELAANYVSACYNRRA